MGHHSSTSLPSGNDSKSNSSNTKPSTMHIPSAAAAAITSSTIYFAYGSNLWLEQMSQRCPTSSYAGIARLPNYRWIINSRGYANIISSTPSNTTTPDDHDNNNHHVYGLVYNLQPSDEARLDINEGVPDAYTKEHHSVDFWPTNNHNNSTVVDVSTQPPSQKMDMLVYIDRVRTVESAPKKEYVYRMNMGIEDALRMGVPVVYVDEVLRRFIPPVVVDWEIKELAARQARRFRDELSSPSTAAAVPSSRPPI